MEPHYIPEVRVAHELSLRGGGGGGVVRARTGAHILAIDPGGTTGWAIAVMKPGWDSRKVELREAMSYWTAGQIAGSDNEQVEELVSLAGDWPDARLVIEDFILRQYSTSRELLSPVRITAAFEYEMWLDGRSMEKQAPSLAKTALTDERMKRGGWWLPGKPHATDATRHVLTFLRRVREGSKVSA